MAKKTVDAVVIGGGVIGSSIAYHMAKQNLNVVMLEKERLAGQASGAAAGMLAAQAESDRPGPLFELLRRSRAMFPEMAEELKQLSGMDIGLVRRGSLKIAATEEQEEELRRMLHFQRQAGEKGERLSGDEARRMEPGLSNAVFSAAYFPDDGQVSAPDLSMAFAKSAAVLGVQIREFAEVKSLLTERGRVAGVMTAEETILCDRVVLASGVWSGGLLKSAGGFELPMYPVKGECFSVVTPAPLIRSTVFAEGCYMVPKSGGRLVVGATAIPHSYDRKVTLKGISALAERARQLLPDISHAEWEKAWCGLRPQTPDGLPYLGEHPELGGLYIAAGHYRNGILLSPITGELAAGWVLGKQEDEAVNAFRVDRLTKRTVEAGGQT